jgi:hypothetical protein
MMILSRATHFFPKVRVLEDEAHFRARGNANLRSVQ